MYTHFNYHFKREVAILQPGDYYASTKDELISTILGSCVAVALFDSAIGAAGLNHFMLPGKVDDTFYLQESGKYGMHAMELLINELYKLGAKRNRLIAKVFGGGSVLAGAKDGNVAHNNIKFAFSYLKTEDIPIVTSDVGGIRARKIFVDPLTAKVMLKKLPNSAAVLVEAEEEKLGRTLKTISQDPIFFNNPGKTNRSKE